MAMTISVVKETNTPSAGNNKACSDGERVERTNTVIMRGLG